MYITPSRANPLGMNAAQLWLEAATVISMRSWGVYANTSTDAENNRMVNEKGPALVNATMDAWSAGLMAALRNPLNPFAAPVAAADAWTRSVTRPARANRRRLVKRAVREASRR